MNNHEVYEPPKSDVSSANSRNVEEGSQAVGPRAKALFSPKAIYIGALVGGPLGAGFGMVRNSFRLGNITGPLPLHCRCCFYSAHGLLA
jgi:hypothetical protein